jgi:hypothetical protein
VAILLLNKKLLIKIIPTTGSDAVLNCCGRKNHANNIMEVPIATEALKHRKKADQFFKDKY